MRLISWNMGCAFPGSSYMPRHERAWRTLLELEPDIALLQEARPPEWVATDGSIVVGRPRNDRGSFQTLIWSRGRRLHRVETSAELAPLIQGQVIVGETVDNSGQPLLVASLHAKTGTWPQEPFAALSQGVRDLLPSSRYVWHSDVMLAEARQTFGSRRFVAAGDLNMASRMDAIYDSNSPMWGSGLWFAQARDAGWMRCHLKFHAGEEQTFFRPGRENEQMYQLDHIFADAVTYAAATRCEVLSFDALDEMSDHAPMLLELA
jgi:endonuclease/exonuclease/phosphatase family metal-dependent hydrolase